MKFRDMCNMFKKMRVEEIAPENNLESIWFNSDMPVLAQLPEGFHSAAIVFHPILKMPDEWHVVKSHDGTIEYPNDDEELKYGIPMKWSYIMKHCGFTEYREMCIALQTRIGALNDKYKRDDLYEKLATYIDENERLFYPDEDNAPIGMIKELLSILQLEGAKQFTRVEEIYSEMNGEYRFDDFDNVRRIPRFFKEAFIYSEDKRFAFLGVYDAFFTVFMSSEHEINSVLKQFDIEGFECTEDTTISWHIKNSEHH